MADQLKKTGVAIKFLQYSSVGIFLLVSIAGAAVMWFRPEKLPDLKEYVGMIWPFWVGEVIPALIGTPLTEAVRAFAARPEKDPDLANDGR